MKSFNLEEYFRNPLRTVVTRDGRKVTRILCNDARGLYPMIVLIDSYDGTNDNPITYTKEGKYFIDGAESKNDLFFEPEKKSGWINLYKINSIISPGPRVYDTKEEAESSAGDKSYYISTIKIEWEE